MTGPTGSNGASGRRDASPVRVLVVDDEPGFADVAASLLEERRDRIEATAATSAAGALDALESGAYDCVVSDYAMPETDGIELLDAVRERHGDAPFVLFTGQGSEAVASEAVSAGVDEYVRKGEADDEYARLAAVVDELVGYPADRLETETDAGPVEDDSADSEDRDLDELSERLQLAVEGADIGVWDWNVQTDEVRFDERWAAMLGYDREEIASDLSAWEDRVHPDDRGSVWDAIEAHFAGETDIYRSGHRMRSKSGEWRWIRDRGRVVEWTDGGEPRRAVGIHIDATEEKERERELERYRRLVDELPEPVCVYDVDARFKIVNDRLAEEYETTPEELVGRRSTLVERIRETHDGDPFAALVEGDRERLSGTAELDVPSTSNMIVDYDLTPLVIDGEFDGVLAVSRDVTEERRRQRRLERTSARLQALFEGSPDMIDIHDERGEILDVNCAMVRELGYDRDEVVGKNVWDVDVELDPSEAGESWRGLDVDETLRLETTFARADGSTFPVEVHVRRIDVRGEDRFLASSRDVSERLASQRRLERENERLDEFASIVSHDLRNPLNVLSGYLRLARETGTDSYFDRCDRALDEMERLIDDVLTLAKQGETVGSFEAVNLGGLAEQCREEAFGTAAEEDPVAPEAADSSPIEVVVETDGEISADPGRVRQLLGNLFRNAAEHGGDRVVVGDLPDGFYVEDDGPGVPEADRDRVFESGYTTSETGTGFGLAIVESIAEAHGWAVELTEGEAGGARFGFTGVGRPGSDG